MLSMTAMHACGVLCFVVVGTTASAPFCTKGDGNACEPAGAQSLLQRTLSIGGKTSVSDELEKRSTSASDELEKTNTSAGGELEASESEYFVGTKNSNTCPEGSSKLTTANECKRAVAAMVTKEGAGMVERLQHMQYMGEKTMDNMPGGCHTGSGGRGHGSWNPSDGSSSDESAPICKKEACFLSDSVYGYNENCEIATCVRAFGSETAKTWAMQQDEFWMEFSTEDIPSAAACQQKCQQTDKCDFFVYLTDAWQPYESFRRSCWLKQAVTCMPAYGSSAGAANTVSGPRTCQAGACDWQCYLDRYPDLQTAFGPTNVAEAERHWDTYGKQEKRNCECDKAGACDWQCYLDRYPDLQTAFGPTNVAEAERHWDTHGKQENRNCECDKAGR